MTFIKNIILYITVLVILTGCTHANKPTIIYSETKNNLPLNIHSYKQKINFNQLFMSILYLYEEESIDIDYFKKVIYLSISKIKNKDYYYDDIDKNLIYLISYEKFKKFEDALKLAISNKILRIDNKTYIINKKLILNKIQINKDVKTKITTLLKKNITDINQELLSHLKKEEEQEYNLAYKNADKQERKDIDIGRPKYYLDKKSDTCIITIHGFSSAPKEVEQLSKYLNANHFNVYSPRLAGHGTQAIDLKDIKWEDWYKSVSRAITIASLQYKNVYIMGFSTGGLLSLQSAIKKTDGFKGIICINAALNLNNIQVKTILPIVSFWNNLVQIFDKTEYAKDYIHNNSENPDVNYNKFYINALEQLTILMEETKEGLKYINKPTLIIQASHDPVVNPSSAYEIHKNIKSKHKILKIVNASNHIIIKGNNTKEVYESILTFLHTDFTK